MKIVHYPAPILSARAAEVEDIDGALVEASDGMLEVMYTCGGIGLAAPQVGLGRRLVVVNLTRDPDDAVTLINPVITERHGLVEAEEGCLSFPGLYSNLARSGRIVVKAYDLDGREVEFEAEGLAARVWQHELDHLDGVLIVSRMTPAQRLAAARTLRQLEREYERQGG